MSPKQNAVEIEYFTINLTVLPAERNTQEYYSALIRKYFRKKMKITLGKDFYYVMTKCQPINEGEAFYIVISKFLQLDNIEWVEDHDGEMIEFEIPNSLEGRKGNYELVFFPKKHKIAYIKKGRINPELKKLGAPLRAMTKVLQIGFEQIVEEHKNVHVDIVQSQQIFDKIYSSDVLKLDLTIHYTNPSTDDDHEEFMDDLLRSARIGKAKFSLTPDSSGAIDTSEAFVSGSLGLAQQNGSVKARIQTEDGIENINTIDHPEVSIISTENSRSRLMDLLRAIINKLNE